jgi:hypothetical protein
MKNIVHTNCTEQNRNHAMCALMYFAEDMQGVELITASQNARSHS